MHPKKCMRTFECLHFVRPLSLFERRSLMGTLLNFVD